MNPAPVPTIREILSARKSIRRSWSEHRRMMRQRKAAARQKELVQQLLGPFDGFAKRGFQL